MEPAAIYRSQPFLHVALSVLSLYPLRLGPSPPTPSCPDPRPLRLLTSMLPSTFHLSLLPLFISLVRAQGPVQTLFPAAIPLAVKTPYLSTWYESVNNSGPLSINWPQFWTMMVSLLLSVRSDSC